MGGIFERGVQEGKGGGMGHRKNAQVKPLSLHADFVWGCDIVSQFEPSVQLQYFDQFPQN